MEDNFSTNRSRGRGWFHDDSVHYLMCYFSCVHELHLRSSGQILEVGDPCSKRCLCWVATVLMKQAELKEGENVSPCWENEGTGISFISPIFKKSR